MPPNKQAKAIVAFEAEEKPFDVTRPSGRLLPGTLHIPTIGGKSSRGGPCVVFMHGTLSDRNHNFVPDLSTKLVKELGVSTYRFDSRFSACEEEPEHRYSFSGYSSDVDDLRCVVKALATEGFDVFCLIGHSRGANDILLFAAEQCANSIYPDAAPQLLDPSKLVLVTAAPRFNMPRMLTTLFSAEKIALIESEGKAPWETQRGDMLVTRGDADVVLKGIFFAHFLILYSCITEALTLLC
jgi:predicted alpha/beta-fold hydrolase